MAALSCVPKERNDDRPPLVFPFALYSRVSPPLKRKAVKAASAGHKDIARLYPHTQPQLASLGWKRVQAGLGERMVESE